MPEKVPKAIPDRPGFAIFEKVSPDFLLQSTEPKLPVVDAKGSPVNKSAKAEESKVSGKTSDNKKRKRNKKDKPATDAPAPAPEAAPAPTSITETTKPGLVIYEKKPEMVVYEKPKKTTPT